MTTQYPSPLGTITLVCNGKSLTQLLLPTHQDGPEKEVQADRQSQDLPVFVETRRWLDLYFSGGKPDFTPLLNPIGSSFQQAVWRELLNIPYGQTTTYGAIAKRLGCRSAQAVGQAIHHNPIAIIIPCHRVIGANGTLTGYASGLEIKRKLLNLEAPTR